MQALIFDIDGTILLSPQSDLTPYKEAVEETLGIVDFNLDWGQYKHVTDTGIVSEAYQKFFGRPITAQIMHEVADNYCSKLQNYYDDPSFTPLPMPGIQKFIQECEKVPMLNLGIATGCWRQSAEIKLQKVGLEKLMKNSATSSEGVTRIQILVQAIISTMGNFLPDQVVYFGDGAWDARACHELGIKFVGVGPELKYQGLEFWYPDFEQASHDLHLMLGTSHAVA